MYLCAVLELNSVYSSLSTSELNNIGHRGNFPTELKSSIFYVRISSQLESVKVCLRIGQITENFCEDKCAPSLTSNPAKSYKSSSTIAAVLLLCVRIQGFHQQLHFPIVILSTGAPGAYTALR